MSKIEILYRINFYAEPPQKKAQKINPKTGKTRTAHAVTALDPSKVYDDVKRTTQGSELHAMRSTALLNMQITAGTASGLLALAAGFTAKTGFKGVAIPALIGAAAAFLASRKIEEL